MTQQPRTPTTEAERLDHALEAVATAQQGWLACIEARADLLAQIEKAVLTIPEHRPPMRNGRRVRDGFSVGFAAGVRTGRETAVLAIRAIRSAAPVEPE